jgi:hypothetical protein
MLLTANFRPLLLGADGIRVPTPCPSADVRLPADPAISGALANPAHAFEASKGATTGKNIASVSNFDLNTKQSIL